MLNCSFRWNRVEESERGHRVRGRGLLGKGCGQKPAGSRSQLPGKFLLSPNFYCLSYYRAVSSPVKKCTRVFGPEPNALIFPFEKEIFLSSPFQKFKSAPHICLVAHVCVFSAFVILFFSSHNAGNLL
jgi:hypothetical protein